MAYRESRGSVVFICLGLLMFITSHCHCMKITRLKALDETRKNTERTQTEGKKSHHHYGRLLIGQDSQKAPKLNGTNSTEPVMDFETDYQADMGWWQTKQLNEQGVWPTLNTEAMQRLLKMESKVECTHDSMKLLVHDIALNPAALIFVDRGQLSPLSLTKLPSSCGYTIRSTQKDLVLVAPYDGCFVIIEEESYVLPLRWWGLPVRMSCPLIGYPSPNPPMVTCHAEGMVVRTEWTSSASEMKANVNGNWEPLLTVAHRCVFGVVEHPEGLVISVRYEPCLGKKDGLYTLELAAGGETKISCPSLLAPQLQPTENLAKGIAQQNEKPNQWMDSFSTPLAILTHSPEQTGFQFPGFNQNPEIPSQPNQVPKETEKFPYTFFPSSFYPHPAFPENTPTEQPQVPSPTKSPVLQTTDKNFNYFPFHQSPLLVVPPTLPPAIKDSRFLYPFRPPQFHQKPVEPPASKPNGQEQEPLDPFYYTQASSQRFYPLYLQQLSGKQGKLDPTVSEKYLPFYLICTQQKPASTHTGSSRDQVYQPFYLLCNQLKAVSDQTVSQQPHPETLQPFFLVCTQQKSPSKPMSPSSRSEDQIYQPFYLLCSQWKPYTQPTGVTQPPQHETLRSNLYQAFFPTYSQPQPTAKPDITQPLQHVPSQNQGYRPLFPFYTQPKPTPKPTGTRPPQPGTHQSQVYLPFFPFYSQPKPTPKIAVTPPPQPGTPQSQVYQPFYHFYTQPQSALKPAYHTTRQPQPGTPQSKVYQPSFSFYAQTNPMSKPAVTKPPQPVTQSQAYHPFFHFYTQPKPTPKPSVTKPPQPSTPQSHVYQQSFQFYPIPKPASKPPVSQPPQMLPAQGHVNQPFYDMKKPELQLPSKPSDPQQSKAILAQKPLYPYPPYMQPKPAAKPKVVPQPLQPETHQGQAHRQMCLYTQLLPESQLANMPSETIQGKVYGPCQQLRKPGGETLLVPKPSSHVQSVYCPQFCPSGLSNCCLQIAFHQHLHISAGRDDEDSPQSNMGLPFSQVVYSEPNKGLKAAQSHQLTDAGILQNVRANSPAHVSPRALQTAGEKQEYFQPPEGNPAALHRSTLSKTANQVPVYPFIQTDPLYPNLAYLPQHIELPNLEQSKSSGFKYPFKPQALESKLLKPGELNDLYNVQFPKPLTSDLLAGNTHTRPNFLSSVGQHGSHTAEQQGQPGVEQQPLHKSEFSSSHHNFKRAIDQFFSPHYMFQDAPEPSRNNSLALNNSQTQPFETGSKNSTKPEQALNSHSATQRFVLLQHGPPGRKPTSFSDSSDMFGHLGHVADSRTQSLPRRNTNQNLEPLQDRSQQFKGEGNSNPLLGNVNQVKRQRLDDNSDLSFFSASEDSDLEYLPAEEYFSSAHLEPEVLESFEDLWKSLTPIDSSQPFASQSPGKNKGGKSAANQPKDYSLSRQKMEIKRNELSLK